MSLNIGLKAIDEAAELGAEWISLTGGEPFLELELIKTLVEYANGRGLKTEVVSNGFWADTPEKAQDSIVSLIGLGLDVLNLSIDDFHQEHVPINFVKNAYDAAKKLELKIVIMTTTSKNNKITAENIPTLLHDEKILKIGGNPVRDPNALLIESPVVPVGRGEHITELDYTLFSEVKCGEALRDIGIGPDGSVFPCCGPLATRMVLGNLNESSLKAILQEAEKNDYINLIRKGVSITGPYTSRCHACVSLLE